MTSRPSTDSALAPSRREGVSRLPGLYMELTKARLSGLVLVTALVGYLLASPRPMDLSRLFWTLVGTALAAAGANALNQWMEVRLDARMERTRERPLPSGRLSATPCSGPAPSTRSLASMPTAGPTGSTSGLG